MEVEGAQGLVPVKYDRTEVFPINAGNAIGKGDLCTLLTNGYVGRHINDANRGARGLGVCLTPTRSTVVGGEDITVITDPDAIYDVKTDGTKYLVTDAGKYCRFIQDPATAGPITGGGISVGYADLENAQDTPGDEEFEDYDEARLKIIGLSNRVNNDNTWIRVKIWAPTFGDTLDETVASKGA
jgi:hypothetical protein